MAKVYHDDDADMSALAGQRVAIIGYGSQGHAHALNLQDSGVNVIVGLYPGSKSWPQAEAQGLPVMPVAEAADGADSVMILAPDHAQGDIYESELAPHMTPGK